MTLKIYNYSHFDVAPAPQLAGDHSNTTVGSRTEDFGTTPKIRFRVAPCSNLGTHKNLESYAGINCGALLSRVAFIRASVACVKEIAAASAFAGARG